MTQTDLFKRLGAPLKNARWSWGAVREDGAVVLRVWQDRMIRLNGKIYMQVTHQTKFEEDPDNLGYSERLEHVSLIEAGAKSYMVMCQARDTKAIPRAIKGFNRKEVFVGGCLVEHDGDRWLEIVSREVVA